MYSNNEYLHTIENTEKLFIITQLSNIISQYKCYKEVIVNVYINNETPICYIECLYINNETPICIYHI